MKIKLGGFPNSNVGSPYNPYNGPGTYPYYPPGTCPEWKGQMWSDYWGACVPKPYIGGGGAAFIGAEDSINSNSKNNNSKNGNSKNGVVNSLASNEPGVATQARIVGIISILIIFIIMFILSRYFS